jgi:pimeloyl-ACP methyl ester carboxylesterase
MVHRYITPSCGRHVASVSLAMAILLVVIPGVTFGAALAHRARASMAADPLRKLTRTMVDVGGYKLSLLCGGTGSPTVIMDSGQGRSGTLDFFGVELEVARFTRVCSYDRAGDGYSDPGPKPRSPLRIILELHTLLQRAHLGGPYVVLGWSIAGLYTEGYAFKYTSTVVGTVLIDPVTPEMYGPASAEEKAMKADDDAGGGYLVDDTTAEEGLAAYDGGAVAVEAIRHPLGRMPLVILTHGINDLLGSDALDQLWRRMQRALLRLSPNSVMLTALDSGHDIANARPDLVIAAIQQVVTAARYHNALAPWRTWRCGTGRCTQVG